MPSRRLSWPHISLKLNPVALYAHETLSSGCNFWVTIWSQHSIDELNILTGTHQSVSAKCNGFVRYFSGICHSIKSLPQHGCYRAYTIKCIGLPDLMDQHTDYRIYQHKTAKDCFNDIAERHHIHIDTKITPHSSVDTFIQFNESNKHFINRLCENYQYVYWHQHHKNKSKIIIVDKHRLLEKPIKKHTIDKLIRCDHQLWKLTQYGCYSCITNLELGDKIAQNQFVTGIRHAIIDDGRAHYYQQYVRLRQTLDLPKSGKMRAIGLDVTQQTSSSSMKHTWDLQSTQRTIPKLEHQSTTLRCHVHFTHQQPLVTAYQHNNLKRPIICGYIFDKHHLSPYGHCKASYQQGMLSSNNGELTYSANHTLKINSLNSINLTTNTLSIQLNCLNIKVEKIFRAEAKVIEIISNDSITLNTSNSRILIAPDKISITAKEIHFNDPGIVVETRD